MPVLLILLGRSDELKRLVEGYIESVDNDNVEDEAGDEKRSEKDESLD